MAVMRPSASTAMRPLMRWSRAWMSLEKLSSRSAMNLTGRAMILAIGRHGHLVGVDVHLDAVAAAHVGADHAHVAFGQAQVLGEYALHHVRRLGGVMDGELGRAAVVVGQDRARLQRQPGVARGVEGGLHHLVGGGEGLLDVAALVDALEAEVVAQLGMDDRRAGIERRLHIHRRRQRLVGDIDLGDGILGDGARLGHHGRHRLADPGGPLDRQGSLRGRFHALEMRQHAHPGLAMGLEVLAGEDAQHAWHLQGLGGVDADNPGVGVRAAHEGHVHHARQHDVVDELAASLDQLLHVGTRHRLADVGVGPVDGAGIDDLVHRTTSPLRPCSLRLDAAAAATASTMAW